VINYDGRRFRNLETGPDGTAPIARYHQDGDLMWGEAVGGDVRRCVVSGLCAPDGSLDFGYSMVLDDGRVVTGHCWSTPEVLEDGRILLHEKWERYGDNPGSGMSYLEELSG
jgi:hypothetical protein